MRITEHFEERLEERFEYNLNTLLIDIKNNLDEKITLFKNSKKVELYPQFKNTFKNYPNCELSLYENLNLCIVSEKQDLITCYTIN